MERYISVLNEEIKFKKTGLPVSSLYIGGGTPSLMGPENLSLLLNTCKNNFNFVSNPEITLEVNPESATPGLFQSAISGGVNRISIGAQSFVPKVLTTLGRIHNVEDITKTFNSAGKTGIKNCSIDLIFGTPGESLEDWEFSLKTLLELNPEHISIYSLTLEEDTPMFQKIKSGQLSPIDDDLSADKFKMGISMLKNAGYKHYEISNFALEDKYVSKHNMHYWDCGEYLGLGCSAHSHLDGERYHNTNNLEEYLSGDQPESYACKYDVEAADNHSRALEKIMLGLRRLEKGVDISGIKEYLSGNILDKLDEFESENLISIKDENIYLTEKGVFFADEILVSFI